MTTGTRLGLFLLTLMVIFAGAFGVGRLAAPPPTADEGPGRPPPTAEPSASQHGGGP